VTPRNLPWAIRARGRVEGASLTMTNRSHIIALGLSFFCIGQCRNGDGSGGGTIFDAEFAQDAFDVLADRPSACAEDDADLIVRFALCDPSQNLRFARGETQ